MTYRDIEDRDLRGAERDEKKANDPDHIPRTTRGKITPKNNINMRAKGAEATERTSLLSLERPELANIAQSRRRILGDTTFWERNEDGSLRRGVIDLGRTYSDIFADQGKQNPWAVNPTVNEDLRAMLEGKTVENLIGLFNDPDWNFEFPDMSWEGPYNWTALEMMSVDYGYPPMALDLVLDSQEMWDDAQPQLDALRKSQAQNLVRLEAEPLWMELQDAGMITPEEANEIAVMLPFGMSHNDFTQVVTEVYAGMKLNDPDKETQSWYRSFFETYIGGLKDIGPSGRKDSEKMVWDLSDRDEVKGRIIMLAYQVMAKRQDKARKDQINTSAGGPIGQALGFLGIDRKDLPSGEALDFVLGRDTSQIPTPQLALAPGIGEISFFEGIEAGFEPFDDFARYIRDDIINNKLIIDYTMDPSQAWRTNLTLGQNIQYMSGVEYVPGENNTMSGLIDGLGILAFDPLNLLFGIGSGAKAAKRGFQVVEGNRSVWKALRDTITPWRKLALPPGMNAPKGIGSKLTFRLFAKTIDEFPSTKHGKAVIERMHETLVNADEATLLDDFGTLQTGLGEHVVVALRGAAAKGVDEFAQTLIDMMKGDYDLAGGAVKQAVRHEAKLAENQLQSVITRELKGTVSEPGAARVQYSQQGPRASVSDLDGLISTEKMVVGDPNTIAGLRNGPAKDGKVVHYWKSAPNDIDVGSDEFLNLLAKSQSPAAQTLRVKLLGKQAEDLINQAGEAMLDLQARGFTDVQEAVDQLQSIIARQGVVDHQAILRGLTPDELSTLKRVANQMGYDAVTAGDSILVTGRGTRKLSRGMDLADDAFRKSQLNKRLGPVQSRVAKARLAKGDLDNITPELWYVDPTPPRQVGGNLAGFRRSLDKLGRTSTADQIRSNWFRNALRSRYAWAASNIFTEIQFDNIEQGLNAIAYYANRMGTSSVDEILQYKQRYLDASRETRGQVVAEIVGDIQRKSGDHKTHLLDESYRDKTTSYIIDNDGQELITSGSRSRGDDVINATPHRPELMGKAYPLPDENYYRYHDRLQRTRSVTSRFRLPGQADRGSLLGFGPTAKRRKKLVQDFRSKVEKKVQAGQDTQHLEDEDYYDLAVAWLGDETAWKRGGNAGGLGMLARVGSGLKVAYKPFHSFFNLVALGTRAVTWPLKVVFGEEQIRAQIAGYHNLYGNPIRRSQTYADMHAVNVLAKHSESILLARKGAYEEIIDPLDEIMKTASHEVFVDSARELYPEAPSLRKVDPEATNEQIMAALREDLWNELESFNFSPGVAKLSDDLERSVNKYTNKRSKLVDKYGANIVDDLADEFFADVMGRSYFDEVANYHKNAEAIFHKSHVEGYAPSRVMDLQEELNSQFAKWAMKRAVPGVGGTIPPSLQKIIISPGWKQMRDNIVSLARKQDPPVDYLNDLELAEWYFDHFYRDNVLNHYLGHFIRDNAGKVSKAKEEAVYSRILLSNVIELDDDLVISLNKRELTQSQKQYKQWLEANPTNFEPDLQLGQRRVALNHIATDGPAGWRHVKGALRKIVEVAGAKTTAQITRKPMMLEMTRQYRDYYKGLGLSDEVASARAKDRASALVNDLMYNMDAAPQMLKSFNQILPFGAAMVEVAKVWMWDLPVKHLNGAGFGHVNLMHKVDRFEDALVGSGLAELVPIDFDDPDGEKRIVLTFERGKMGPSGWVHAMLSPLEVAGQHFGAAKRWLLSENPEVEGSKRGYWVKPGSDKFTINWGLKFSPLRGLDPNSYGLAAVNQIAVSLNPVAGFAVSKALNADFMAWAGLSSEPYEVIIEPGETLADVAAKLGVDVEDLTMSNANVRAILGDADIAKEIIEKRRAQENWFDVVLPAGTKLHVPNTGAVNMFFDNYVFPFGRHENPADVIRSYAPNWFQGVLQSWGIHEGIWEEDGDSKGILSTLIGPNAVFKNDQYLHEGALYQELMHGSISSTYELVDEINVLEEELIADGVAFRLDNGQIQSLTDAAGRATPDERWALLDSLKLGLEADIDSLFESAADYAAQKQMGAAFLGAIVPGSPKAYSDHIGEVQGFWAGKAMIDSLKDFDVEGIISAKERIANLEGKDFGQAMALVRTFIEDKTLDTTSELKRAFSEQFGVHTLAYLEPSLVYNGPLFTEAPSYQEYLEQIERGDRAVIAPDVFLMRTWNTRLTWDQIIAKHEAFGVDENGEKVSQEQKFLNMLANPDKVSEISAEFSQKRAGLTYYDTEYMDGDYSKFKAKQKEVTDPDTARQVELDANIDRLNIYMDDVVRRIAENDMLMAEDPIEAKARASELSQEKALIQEQINTLKELEENNFFGEDADRYYGQWFSDVYRPYQEERQKLYDQAYATEDQEVRRRMFDNVRMLVNEEWDSVRYVAGTKVPNAVEWTVSLQGEDEFGNNTREQYLLKALAKKPEWLTKPEIEGLLELAGPELGKFFPVGHNQWREYVWRNEQLNKISQWALDGVAPHNFNEDGTRKEGRDGMFTARDATKMKDQVEEAFNEALVSQGRIAEIQFQELRPKQQLQVLGLMPPSLENIMAMGETLAAYKDAYNAGLPEKKQKSFGTDIMKDYWKTNVWPVIEAELQNNPQARKDLEYVAAFYAGRETLRETVYYLVTGSRALGVI